MNSRPKPAIIAFTETSGQLAARLSRFVGGEVFDSSARGGDVKAFVSKSFAQNRPIIGICATGILVRLLASKLSDKTVEPPVIAVSASGKHVVPLLGGHHGANELAKEIADFLGCSAAITTASEQRFTFALDHPPAGYVLANPELAKPVMAALLNGSNLRVKGQSDWLQVAGYPVADSGEVEVHVSEMPNAGNCLTFRPKSLIAGVGCARHTKSEEIIALVEKSLARANLAPQSLAAIASIELKSDEAGLVQAAQYFGVPFRVVSTEQLTSVANQVPNPSAIVEKEIGTPSVAEAAAILAGELAVEKQKTANATCAIGKADQPIQIKEYGRAPGQLHLVGIGPGQADQRTVSASAALEWATEWVGYGLYLDLIDDIHCNQNQHRFDLGDEEARVRFALELAATGKTVALICSGDAQIYAMASLVYELLDAKDIRALSEAARRVAVQSHPGISALQMASARAGALLGHDFCTISLSDLLTPKADIEQRLLAAATGDFVTAFYNPRSRRRTDLIEYAKQLFLQHRPADTPVIIASNLGREGENVRVVRLEDFNPEEIDMLTIVLFGSTNSKSFMRGDGKTVAFTPRGYANKAAVKPARKVLG